MPDLVVASGLNLQAFFCPFMNTHKFPSSLRKNIVEITVTQMFHPALDGIKSALFKCFDFP